MKLSGILKRVIPISLAFLLTGCAQSADPPTVQRMQDDPQENSPDMVEFILLTKAEMYRDGELMDTCEFTYTDDYRVDVVRRIRSVSGSETVSKFSGAVNASEIVSYIGGEVDGRQCMTYDEAGELLLSEQYNGDGTLLYRTECTAEQRVSVDYGEDGSVQWKGISRYDERGNLVESIGYGADGTEENRTVYIYDESGNELSWETYHMGQVMERNESTYDENGNLIRQDTYYDLNLGNTTLSCYALFTYDEAGNRIERRGYEGDGRLSSVDTYTYDDAGNRISSMYQWFLADGTVESTSVYTYRLNSGEYAKYSFQTMVDESYVSYEGDLDGELIAEERYTYGDNGFPLEHYDRVRDSEERYVFHYNEQGIMTGWECTTDTGEVSQMVYTTEVIEVPADQAEELLKHDLRVWGGVF